MNINKNQFEILSYIEREGGRKITQRELADRTPGCRLAWPTVRWASWTIWVW